MTIDGVRFVVDSGAVKEMHYDGEARMASLTPYWVSKASAEQRKGRAGRTGPGVCFRLYSADEFTRLDEFATPELLRSPLEPTVLQLLGLGVSPMISFEWLSPPAASAIAASLDSLRDLRAIGPPPGEVTSSNLPRPTRTYLRWSAQALTTLGAALAKLPVDLHVGKMLLLGAILG